MEDIIKLIGHNKSFYDYSNDELIKVRKYIEENMIFIPEELQDKK